MTQVTPTLLFLGNAEDQNYLPRLKPHVGGASVYVNLSPILTWAEVSIYCRNETSQEY